MARREEKEEGGGERVTAGERDVPWDSCNEAHRKREVYMPLMSFNINFIYILRQLKQAQRRLSKQKRWRELNEVQIDFSSTRKRKKLFNLMKIISKQNC